MLLDSVPWLECCEIRNRARSFLRSQPAARRRSQAAEIESKTDELLPLAMFHKATSCIDGHAVFSQPAPLIAICVILLACLSVSVACRQSRRLYHPSCPDGSIQVGFVVFVIGGVTISLSLYIGATWVHLFAGVTLACCAVALLMSACCHKSAYCGQWRSELTFLTALAVIPSAALLQTGIVQAVYGGSALQATRDCGLAALSIAALVWVGTRACHDHVRVDRVQNLRLLGAADASTVPLATQPSSSLDGDAASRQHRASDLDLVFLAEKRKQRMPTDLLRQQLP